MMKILKGTTKTVRSLERRIVKNVKGVGLETRGFLMGS